MEPKSNFQHFEAEVKEKFSFLKNINVQRAEPDIDGLYFELYTSDSHIWLNDREDKISISEIEREQNRLFLAGTIKFEDGKDV